ncbi:MAG: hypothetical protein AAF411_20680 [Myxococcota bacterium]
MMDSDQRTAVAGYAAPGPGPKRGEVLGERYELRGRLRNDAFSLGYLAFDQEDEQSVLLRLVRPEVLDGTVLDDVAERLRKSVGCGGNYLPGLLDGDRDDRFVYATEPVPEGASFRDVLDRRIATKRPLEPHELLPLVSHLETALLAVPSGMRHGDVRAENVWTDPERLQLTGAFLLSAMPGGSVANVVQRSTGLKRRFAPEVSMGGGTKASDLYGVGCIVFEALTLLSPPVDGHCAAVTHPDLRRALEPLLSPSENDRPGSLHALVETLARAAKLPVPELEPAPFRHEAPQAPVRRPSALQHDDATTVDRAPTRPEPPTHDLSAEQSRRAEASARVSAERLKRSRVLRETERSTRAAAAGLDPRLVRAALTDKDEGAHHLDYDPSPAEEALDGPLQQALGIEPEPEREAPKPVPKPVPKSAVPKRAVPKRAVPLRAPARAAPISERTSEGVPLDPSVPVAAAAEGTQEIGLDELEDLASGRNAADFEASADVPLDPAVAVGPAADGTQEISFDELDDMERAAGGGQTRSPVQLSDLAGMAPRVEQPVPVPRLELPKQPLPPVMVAAADPAHAMLSTSPPSSQPELSAQPQPAPSLNPPAELEDSGPFTQAKTSPGALPLRRPAPTLVLDRSKGRSSDLWIIAAAIFVGALMILGAALYKRNARQEELEQRQRQIQQRAQQVQE